MLHSSILRRATHPHLGTFTLTVAALSAAVLCGCGSSKPQPSSTPAAAASAASSAAGSNADKKSESAKKDEPHCFLGDSDANEYAHELMLAVFSSAKFNQKRISKASTPENLKVMESSLRQQMFQVACKKAWTDDKDTVEGALLVLGLMGFDDEQWNAAMALVGTPTSYRALPSEAQDWLKDAATLDALKTLAKAQSKPAADLLAAAAKELKCGKEAVSVKVKSRKVAEVEGCKRTATMRDGGGWKRDGQ